MLSTVALVADDPDAAVNIVHTLEREGCAVTAFSHCVDLFHSVSNWAPDVVVLDLGVWTIREHAITKVLHERLNRPATRFVLITSAVELGQNIPEAVDTVVVRPFTSGDLMRAVAGEASAPHTPTVSFA